jgi:5-methyltetrahydrofolate--homocysteine methyltransferase
MSEPVADLKEAVINGKRIVAEELTLKALEAGVAPAVLLSDALIPAMSVVGERFRNGEYFVPEMLMAAKSMKAAMAILKPKMVAGSFASAGRVIIGTVRGDLHDIGKNLVKMMLEGAGFEVVDLGVDVGPDKFVAAVQEHKPQLIAMSALLTTTMLAMVETIKALTAAGLRGKVKILIGGAATTESFAREIGADGYGADAHTATELAKTLAAAPA